jgi:hypothetical protein
MYPRRQTPCNNGVTLKTTVHGTEGVLLTQWLLATQIYIHSGTCSSCPEIKHPDKCSIPFFHSCFLSSYLFIRSSHASDRSPFSFLHSFLPLLIYLFISSILIVFSLFAKFYLSSFLYYLAIPPSLSRRSTSKRFPRFTLINATLVYDTALLIHLRNTRWTNVLCNGIPKYMALLRKNYVVRESEHSSPLPQNPIRTVYS